MRLFKDCNGQDWSLSVNMASAMLLKTEAGVDILDIAEGKDLAQLTSQVDVLGACLWLLVREQAQAKTLDEKKFFALLDGDSVDRATKAFIAECFDFFPPAKRTLLQSAYQKICDVESRGIARAMQILQETTDEQFETLVNGIASGSRPPLESPSNPGDSLSAS